MLVEREENKSVGQKHSGGSLTHWLTVEWHKKTLTFTSFVGMSFKTERAQRKRMSPASVIISDPGC